MGPLAIVIDLDPNLLQAGPFLVTWHGLFSVLGILAAIRVAQHLSAATPFPGERVFDMAFWMVIGGLVGARMLYVWENYQLFVGQWLRALAVNEGGISQWGGIFGALAGSWAWCRRHRVDVRHAIDLGGPATALGFAVGRIGDVINGEHHAVETNLPIGVEYVNQHTLGEPGKVVHLEVGYELAFDLALFGLAYLLWRPMTRRLPPGITGLVWLVVYSGGRFLLSFLRQDSLFAGLRQAQWASIAMVVLAAVLAVAWTWRPVRPTPPPPAAAA